LEHGYAPGPSRGRIARPHLTDRLVDPLLNYIQKSGENKRVLELGRLAIEEEKRQAAEKQQAAYVEYCRNYWNLYPRAAGTEKGNDNTKGGTQRKNSRDASASDATKWTTEQDNDLLLAKKAGRTWKDLAIELGKGVSDLKERWRQIRPADFDDQTAANQGGKKQGGEGKAGKGKDTTNGGKQQGDDGEAIRRSQAERYRELQDETRKAKGKKKQNVKEKYSKDSNHNADHLEAGNATNTYKILS
jgi:hypothetical protein